MPARIAVAAVGAVTLAVATGLPPFYDAVVHLPGFDAANNGRFAVIAILALALLAGWGLDELSGRELTAVRVPRLLRGRSRGREDEAQAVVARALRVRGQEMAEQRDEDQQQREDREDRPEGDHAGQVHRAVLVELAEHRHRDRRGRAPLLEAVEPFGRRPGPLPGSFAEAAAAAIITQRLGAHGAPSRGRAGTTAPPSLREMLFPATAVKPCPSLAASCS